MSHGGAKDAKEYVLGTDAEEIARLGLQHRLWSEQTFALWARAGFGPGQTILDVGCGPGFATFDLAQLVGPTGRVVAVDESPHFVGYLDAQRAARGVANVDTQLGDVHHLNLPPCSVDRAYARWVLCFVRDPELVIRRVADALRPGGRFAVQDYFDYASLTLAPRSEVFRRVVQAVSRSWRDHGGDDDVAARIPGMMRRAGLEVLDVRPNLRVARPHEPLWAWPTSFFRSFLPRLVQMNAITQDTLDEFAAEWNARSHDPDTFFVAPVVYDIIGRKPD